MTNNLSSMKTLCFQCVVLAGWVALFPLSAHTEEASDDWREKTVVAMSLKECCPEVAWLEAEKRIVRELESSGFNVVSTPGRPGVEWEGELEQEIVKERADAGVALAASEDGGVVLAILVRREETGSIARKTLHLDLPPTDDQSEIAALRAGEAVRAALFEDPVTSEPSTPDETVEPSSGEFERAPLKNGETSREEASGKTDRRQRWRLGAGFLGQWAPGGIGMRGAVRAGATWLSPFRVAAGISGRVSMVGRDISSHAATATFDMAFGRVQVGWLPRPLRFFQPLLGLSVGVAYVWTTGASDRIDDLKTDGVTRFYGGGFLEGSFVISERIAVPVTLEIGTVQGGIAVRFGGETVSRLKMPLVEAGLGVAVILG